MASLFDHGTWKRLPKCSVQWLVPSSFATTPWAFPKCKWLSPTELLLKNDEFQHRGRPVQALHQAFLFLLSSIGSAHWLNPTFLVVQMSAHPMRTQRGGPPYLGSNFGNKYNNITGRFSCLEFHPSPIPTGVYIAVVSYSLPCWRPSPYSPSSGCSQVSAIRGED